MVPRTPRRGYSLAEVLVASGLAGVVLVAALDGMSGSARAWRVAGDARDAHALAHDLLAEIVSQAYSDPDTTDDPNLTDFGPESDESTADRGQFDDVDDYDDWTETPPRTRSGAVLAGYSGWTRSVVVRKLKKRKVGDFRNDGQDDHASRQITVTVTDAGGDTHTVQAVRARHGALERPLGVTTEFVTGVSVSLTAGGGNAIQSTRGLINHAEGP